MKKLFFTIAVFSCFLPGLAHAQYQPWSSQFAYNTYYFRGTHLGPWGVPDNNTPIVGAGAYCHVGDPAIGITMGPYTGCTNTVTITANGGKDPSAWILYASGSNWEPYYQTQTRAWYYWTSCDIAGATRRTFDNPTGTPDGTWAPESC